jgi:hypothetical protein
MPGESKKTKKKTKTTTITAMSADGRAPQSSSSSGALGVAHRVARPRQPPPAHGSAPIKFLRAEGGAAGLGVRELDHQWEIDHSHTKFDAECRLTSAIIEPDRWAPGKQDAPS